MPSRLNIPRSCSWAATGLRRTEITGKGIDIIARSLWCVILRNSWVVIHATFVMMVLLEAGITGTPTRTTTSSRSGTGGSGRTRPSTRRSTSRRVRDFYTFRILSLNPCNFVIFQIRVTSWNLENALFQGGHLRGFDDIDRKKWASVLPNIRQDDWSPNMINFLYLKHILNLWYYNESNIVQNGRRDAGRDRGHHHAEVVRRIRAQGGHWVVSLQWVNKQTLKYYNDYFFSLT